MTLLELQAAMTQGKLTSRRITELYLARIQAIDRAGPTLRSVLTVNPDALAIAAALDAERRQKGPRGVLHGIPILVKDNIDTADKMPTTAGSLALERNIAPKDSFVVERLRAAGAVILGKTNLSEWANFRSTSSVSGWSAMGGLTRNPYVLDRSACGSSSGSGVAVAANLAAAAIGTETDGSIVCPSAVNGIVGVKPTVGLVSRAGIIPISHSQDTAGPMARTVADAAALLGALRGVDPRDEATRPSTPVLSRQGEPATWLDGQGLRGARIGIARKELFGFSPHADRLTAAALEVLKARGAVLVDPVELPHYGSLGSDEKELLLFEFKADLNRYLEGAGPGAAVRSLQALIAFNDAQRAREMPHFGQELFLEAQRRGPLTDTRYRQALSRLQTRSRGQGLDAVLSRHRLDALVAPTTAPAWIVDSVNGDHYLGSSSRIAAVSGYPSVTVPAGQVNGLPVGISFIGKAWSEPRLLALAYDYEQATRHRRAPQFVPTVRVEP
jgi:amidase